MPVRSDSQAGQSFKQNEEVSYMYAGIGDQLVVEGDAARAGLIIGVPHQDGSPPYIVKWLADGHIAMVTPGQFARIVRAENGAAHRRPAPDQARQAGLSQRRGERREITARSPVSVVST